MRIFLCLCFLAVASFAEAQEDFLPKQYFNDGEYAKALVFYEKLTKKRPRARAYAEALIKCYQQLEQYDKAEAFINKRIASDFAFPTIFIELGYNYAKQDQADQAKIAYDKAIASLDENPNYAFSLGARFQEYALLDYAILTYNKAMELNPSIDNTLQIARVYGEQGKIEKMFASYLDLIKTGRYSKSNVLRNINNFITEDPEGVNNKTLKKLLLTNAQKNPDVLWNEMLSWLFVQQKQYNSAFNQEKAIYKRAEASSLQRINRLADLALADNDITAAERIYQFVVDNSEGGVTQLNAQLQLIDIALLDPNDAAISKVEKTFSELIDLYGYRSRTLQLQVAYANFLTFQKNTPEPAIQILDKALQLPLNAYGKGRVKMALGDILVYDQKFNRALIYFTQIQKEKGLKNDVLAQNARFKVAQTSFYKGDFDWALTQLKVLRGSTSQLIANDAMQLSLLIADNSLEDSTQTALKKYARADLLAYQNKKRDAIQLLAEILEQHKGEKVEDEALLKQGQLLEDVKEYDNAKFNYQKIVEFYSTDILADDALFALGKIYEEQLNEPTKAQEYYEKIIYNHQDSYYFPQARKNYRRLRGDTIN